MIKIEIILRRYDLNNYPETYCSLELDCEDENLMEKIKDHIEIFKTVTNKKVIEVKDE